MEYKYPHIVHVGDEETEGLFLDEVVVTEKLDGANSSFVVESGRLVFRTRNRVLPKEEHNSSAWVKATKYIFSKFDEHPELVSPDLVYYAETMVKHTLNYNWENIPPLVGFDVLDKSTGLFFGYKQAQKEFEKQNIPFVPILFSKSGPHVKVEELEELVKTLQSQYGGMAEGIVVKNYSRLNRYGRPLFGKIVRDDFKERNRLAFAGVKELRNEEKNIVNEFCTPARVTKCIHKLTLEQGKPLSMKLMPDLFKMVADDILSEEITRIASTYSSLHFKEFTNLVAARCAKTLKDYMMQNSNRP